MTGNAMRNARSDNLPPLSRHPWGEGLWSAARMRCATPALGPTPYAARRFAKTAQP